MVPIKLQNVLQKLSMHLFSEGVQCVLVEKTGRNHLWHFNQPLLLLSVHTHKHHMTSEGRELLLWWWRGCWELKRIGEVEHGGDRQPEETYLLAGMGGQCFLCVWMVRGKKKKKKEAQRCREVTFLREGTSVSSCSHCNLPRRSFHGGCNWVFVRLTSGSL